MGESSPSPAANVITVFYRAGEKYFSMNSLSWLNFKCEPYGHGLRGWGFDGYLWLVTSNSKKVIKHTSRKETSNLIRYLVDVSDAMVR